MASAASSRRAAAPQVEVEVRVSSGTVKIGGDLVFEVVGSGYDPDWEKIMTNHEQRAIVRQPAEVLYAEELAALRANDPHPRPPGCAA